MNKTRLNSGVIPSTTYLYDMRIASSYYLPNSYNRSSKTFSRLSESLTGQTGFNGAFRPCDHSTITQELRLGKQLFSFPQYPPGLTIGLLPGVAGQLLKDSALAVPDIAVLSESEWNTLDIEALQTMLPSMSNGFSLINFLIELKDFRHLASAFLQRKGRLAAALLNEDPARSGNIPAKLNLKMKMKEMPLKTASQAYLNYSFGWAPFVSDVINVWESLTSFKKRLKDIRQRAGKHQTRHYTRVLSEDDIVEHENVYLGKMISTYNCDMKMYSTQRVIQPSVYHATCRYSYTMPDVSDAELEANALLDSLGVRPDPSIIWNAIPFTFLIDWVIDVGGFLRRFSTDNLGLKTVVHDFCSSHKSITTRSIRLKAYYGPSWNNWESPNSPVVTNVTKRRYIRRKSIPSLTAALASSGISTRELTLSAALLATNGRKPRGGL